ncbi:perlucin-like isoform X2 [Dreissena polymorpha]|uniref:perlucin-like isoform X2 n=1 Tax=Dreissena polymorpha TaxID=45954 RepID=UPI002264C6FC|nr:perlucin-like isoform X2 [Dreissena polymorpha]
MHGYCPAGFEALGDHCYTILKVMGSYAEGKTYCNMAGASLAVIRSREEENLIDSYIRRHMSQIQSSQIWIGGSDILQEGTFLAPGSQEVLTYFNWAPNEPDNAGPGQHCLNIFRDDSQLRWDDDNCEFDRFPMCQREQVDQSVVG